MVFCYMVSIALFIISIVFFSGKGAAYIKGYRIMPEEEKRRINIKALCKNLGAMLFLAAVIFGIAGCFEVFKTDFLKWAVAGWMALCFADIVFMNKSKQYIN